MNLSISSPEGFGRYIDCSGRKCRKLGLLAEPEEVSVDGLVVIQTDSKS